MPRFILRDLEFHLPQSALSPSLEQALTNGRYEHGEAECLLRHLKPEDRYVDFGAGMGYLTALAARVCGAENVTGVEAGPETAILLRDNLDRNGFGAATVIQGAVVAEDDPPTLLFHPRAPFWSSALARPNSPEDKLVEVPAIAAAPLLERLQPTVLSCDIEGAELQVLEGPFPKSLRLMIVEIHPGNYGRIGTAEIFVALAGQGFAYVPEGSRGAVLVFGRI